MCYCKNHRGSILVIAIASIALLTIIAAAMAHGWKTNTTAMRVNNCATQLAMQAKLIQMRIARCAADYPSGDNGTLYNKPYPGGSGVAVSGLTCPGTGTSIWAGYEGAGWNPTLMSNYGFGGWVYANDATNIRFQVTTTTPTESGACMQQALKAFGSNEAGIITSNIFRVLVKI